MREQLQTLATLTRIDVELEELQEELGDLPGEVKRLEREVRLKQQAFDATQKQLDDVYDARAAHKIRTQELHDKEKRLTEQQFQVRNNREFDAITHEVSAIKQELRDLERDLAAGNLTEDNLQRILGSQEEELKTLKEKLTDKEQELMRLSGNHNDELTELLNKRTALVAKLPANVLLQYDRIREFHTNAAVSVRRNSCSGCFNAIPPQKLVEIRAYKQMFTCESCGRILYPEDMEVSAV